MLSRIALSTVVSFSCVTVANGNDIDCEYSNCNRALTTADCTGVATACNEKGGVPSCLPGQFEYECNNINLANNDNCITDQAATNMCSTFDFSSDISCPIIDGDCDTTDPLTRAPTAAGAYAGTIDCSFDSCSLPLTSTDCDSLTARCSLYGGVMDCEVGDNEFECKNIDYAGTAGSCTDASALAQCNTYDFPGYTCSEREGDCDDIITSTFAPTPAINNNVQSIDCSYEDCTTFLSSEDCLAISTACSGIGGVAFCVPGTDEFECNNIEWSGTSGCSDSGASSQCVQYSFPGMTCADNEGDCNSMSSSSDDDRILSDSERILVAFAIPLLLVGGGGLIWYILSARNRIKPPAATPPPVEGSSAFEHL